MAFDFDAFSRRFANFQPTATGASSLFSRGAAPTSQEPYPPRPSPPTAYGSAPASDRFLPGTYVPRLPNNTGGSFSKSKRVDDDPKALDELIASMTRDGWEPTQKRGNVAMNRRKALSGVGLAIGAVLTGVPRAAGQGTPCPDAPIIEDRYTYDPDEPILLIGTGNASTTLDVQRLEDDYIGFTVHYGGNDRFEASLVSPDGERDSIFTAIRPEGVTSSQRADGTGEYTIEVEASGPWSIFVH
ncbi:MAG: hypothetical protein M3Q10_02810 [Chloroflexota bacterium]|nr:hypothetical protein [Chloroflexota bacterium]